MFHLEFQSAKKRRIKEATDQVAELMEFSKARGAYGNDVELNRELKRRMRVQRASDRASEQRCVSLESLCISSCLLLFTCSK
jgi:hypothetical protein